MALEQNINISGTITVEYLYNGQCTGCSKLKSIFSTEIKFRKLAKTVKLNKI